MHNAKQLARSAKLGDDHVDTNPPNLGRASNGTGNEDPHVVDNDGTCANTIIKSASASQDQVGELQGNANLMPTEGTMEKEAGSTRFKTQLLSELPPSIKRRVMLGAPSPCGICHKSFPSYQALFGHYPIHAKECRDIMVTYEVGKGINRRQIKESDQKPSLPASSSISGTSLQRDNMDLDFDLNLPLSTIEEDDN